MNQILRLQAVSLAYGLDPLLDKVDLEVKHGERICLIGRNGAGKSSLMKIMAGMIKPDAGEVWHTPSLRIAYLDQTLPQDLMISVYEFVALGIAEQSELLTEFHHLTQVLGSEPSDEHLKRLSVLQTKMDATNAWQADQSIQTILTQLELNANQSLSTLSGGWQRRASLAKALVGNPDLLLLDEPTNHLDITFIDWLENKLLSRSNALVFITHDRVFLQRLATRIIELDRGQLTSWSCTYDQFCERKEAQLAAEAAHNHLFDKVLAAEERWVRQGIKARRTRNEGRVRALEAMRKERKKRIAVQGNVNLTINQAELSGALVLEANALSHRFSEKTIVNHFSLRIMRGDRIALIGPNGIGKSTLINILLKKITPDQGTVTLGTKLKIVYFDQLRAQLDYEKPVRENVVAGSDFVEINGVKKHVISYLNDFLFSAARAQTPVKALSGGECNRLLLAKLFSQPSNLLILDEPTNDLDIETLELLEDLLANYKGTLILVSHDRKFVDNVVTSTLFFAGEGNIMEYVGGYEDAIAQHKEKVAPTPSKKPSPSLQSLAGTKTLSGLTYQEKQELQKIPSKIEKLEGEYQTLTEASADANFYQQDQPTIATHFAKMKALETEIAEAYARWEMLDSKK